MAYSQHPQYQAAPNNHGAPPPGGEQWQQPQYADGHGYQVNQYGADGHEPQGAGQGWGQGHHDQYQYGYNQQPMNGGYDQYYAQQQYDQGRRQPNGYGEYQEQGYHQTKQQRQQPRERRHPEQLDTRQKPKPRERILQEPVSPDTLAWDNPFPTFNTKKKDKQKKHNSIEAEMGKMGIQDPSHPDRPHTSHAHRKPGDIIPPTSQTQRRPDESRPHTSHGAGSEGRGRSPSGGQLSPLPQQGGHPRMRLDPARVPPTAIGREQYHNQPMSPLGGYDTGPQGFQSRSRGMSRSNTMPDVISPPINMHEPPQNWQDPANVAGYHGPSDRDYLDARPATSGGQPQGKYPVQWPTSDLPPSNPRAPFPPQPQQPQQNGNVNQRQIPTQRKPPQDSRPYQGSAPAQQPPQIGQGSRPSRVTEPEMPNFDAMQGPVPDELKLESVAPPIAKPAYQKPSYKSPDQIQSPTSMQSPVQAIPQSVSQPNMGGADSALGEFSFGLSTSPNQSRAPPRQGASAKSGPPFQPPQTYDPRYNQSTMSPVEGRKVPGGDKQYSAGGPTTGGVRDRQYNVNDQRPPTDVAPTTSNGYNPPLRPSKGHPNAFPPPNMQAKPGAEQSLYLNNKQPPPQPFPGSEGRSAQPSSTTYPASRQIRSPDGAGSQNRRPVNDQSVVRDLPPNVSSKSVRSPDNRPPPHQEYPPSASGPRGSHRNNLPPSRGQNQPPLQQSYPPNGPPQQSQQQYPPRTASRTAGRSDHGLDAVVSAPSMQQQYPQYDQQYQQGYGQQDWNQQDYADGAYGNGYDYGQGYGQDQGYDGYGSEGYAQGYQHPYNPPPGEPFQQAPYNGAQPFAGRPNTLEQQGSRHSDPHTFPGPLAGTAGPAGPNALPPNGALNARPPPVRPGLDPQITPTTVSDKPPPVRQYDNTAQTQQQPSQQKQASRPSSDQPKRASIPVTAYDLNLLQQTIRSNPEDHKTALTYAKKLVEAASVLANEGGKADAKTTQKNRERYIFDAHKQVKKLVNVGYPDAMFFLADCYGTGGLGLQVDPHEAFKLYQSAAKVGHPQAAYRVAVCCEMGNEEGGGTKRDPIRAVQWYKRAATMGDPPAMYKTAMISLKGLLGQPQNPREAFTWLKRAAEKADRENPHALHELGLLYESAGPNDAVIRDMTHARELFERAAKLGYKFSQHRLATAYERGGLDCQIDPRQSIMWYSKAAAKGEHHSELALSGWYLTGSEGILQQSDTEAYLWARKAAQSGLAKAEYAMGYYTEVGIGVSPNLDEAKKWYWRAASQNFPKARERLEALKKGGAKMQKTRLSRSNINKQNEGDCRVM